MMTQEELFGKCPYATAQRVLSGKWALILLHHLSEETRRFNELQRLLPDLTQATLTKQLRQLENYGMIHREVYAQIPPKVEYSLTEPGRAFTDVLQSLKQWGDQYIRLLQDGTVRAVAAQAE